MQTPNQQNSPHNSEVQPKADPAESPSSETDIAADERSKERMCHFSRKTFTCFLSPCIFCVSLVGKNTTQGKGAREMWAVPKVSLLKSWN